MKILIMTLIGLGTASALAASGAAEQKAVSFVQACQTQVLCDVALHKNESMMFELGALGLLSPEDQNKSAEPGGGLDAMDGLADAASIKAFATSMNTQIQHPVDPAALNTIIVQVTNSLHLAGVDCEAKNSPDSCRHHEWDVIRQFQTELVAQCVDGGQIDLISCVSSRI